MKVGDMDDFQQQVVLVTGGTGNLGPVSYTHLDVYKRQVEGVA